jgi:hypothetical protein
MRKEAEMTTISQEAATGVRRPAWVDARNMWASLAIVAIWLVVLVLGLFGPDFESVGAGGDRTTIPSAIGVSVFALFSTIAVAKYGFDRRRDA